MNKPPAKPKKSADQFNVKLVLNVLFFVLFVLVVVAGVKYLEQQHQIYRSNANLKSKSDVVSTSKPLCTLGTKKPCTAAQGCAGYRVCRGDGWSECIVPMNCSPGSTRNCYVDQCHGGVQVCNACGQWGPCHLTNSTSNASS